MRRIVLLSLICLLTVSTNALAKKSNVIFYAFEDKHYNPQSIYHKDSLNNVFSLLTLPHPITAYGRGKFLVRLEVYSNLKRVLKFDKFISHIKYSKDETGWEFHIYSKKNESTSVLCWQDIKEYIDKFKSKESLTVKLEYYWVHPDYKIEKKTRFKQGSAFGQGQFTILPKK